MKCPKSTQGKQDPGLFSNVAWDKSGPLQAEAWWTPQSQASDFTQQLTQSENYKLTALSGCANGRLLSYPAQAL